MAVHVQAAAEWIVKVLDIRRINERLVCLRILLVDQLINCICAYAPQMGRVKMRRFLCHLFVVVGSVLLQK